MKHKKERKYDIGRMMELLMPHSAMEAIPDCLNKVSIQYESSF